MPYKGRHLVDGEMRGYRPSMQMRQAVLTRDGRLCQGCGSTVAKCYQVTHVLPWPQGPTDMSNLRVLCQSCNLTERRRWGLSTAGQYGVAQRFLSEVEIRALMERALAHG